MLKAKKIMKALNERVSLQSKAGSKPVDRNRDFCDSSSDESSASEFQIEYFHSSNSENSSFDDDDDPIAKTDLTFYEIVEQATQTKQDDTPSTSSSQRTEYVTDTHFQTGKFPWQIQSSSNVI